MKYKTALGTKSELICKIIIPKPCIYFNKPTQDFTHYIALLKLWAHMGVDVPLGVLTSTSWNTSHLFPTNDNKKGKQSSTIPKIAD